MRLADLDDYEEVLKVGVILKHEVCDERMNELNRLIAAKARRQTRREPEPEPEPPPAISPTEHANLSLGVRRVLEVLATGASNQEIARKLGLADQTVKNYISTAVCFTGARDREQLMLLLGARRLCEHCDGQGTVPAA